MNEKWNSVPFIGLKAIFIVQGVININGYKLWPLCHFETSSKISIIAITTLIVIIAHQ